MKILIGGIPMQKTPKRIVIEVSNEFHKEIKKRAADRNISIKKYFMRAILDFIKKEKDYEQPD